MLPVMRISVLHVGMLLHCGGHSRICGTEGAWERQGHPHVTHLCSISWLDCSAGLRTGGCVISSHLRVFDAPLLRVGQHLLHAVRVLALRAARDTQSITIQKSTLHLLSRSLHATTVATEHSWHALQLCNSSKLLECTRLLNISCGGWNSVHA